MLNHHENIRQAIIQNNELGAASAMRSHILDTHLITQNQYRINELCNLW